MRWRRRIPLHRTRVALDVFENRSRAEGFVLDGHQRRAAETLVDVTGLGVYLWGPPGRGKTWLLDTYFDALPTDRKVRLHFHEFFRELHSSLVRSRYHLAAGLDALLGPTDVICFDEFHVHDVGDARFLERLLPALLARGTTIVATSNYPPDGLLPNPLFHHTFVPTIMLMKRAMTVVSVDGATDYRSTRRGSEVGFGSGAWVVPGTPEQVRSLGLTRPGPREHRTLEPAGHPVNALRADSECLWFGFDDLCRTGTAPADYIELAGRHRSWVVSDVPDLAHVEPDAVQRFVNLVDVLYDRDIEVIFLARTDLELLSVENGPTDAARLVSRLRQLQTSGRPMSNCGYDRGRAADCS